MKPLALFAASVFAACASSPSPGTELARWEQQARNVTITRDDWGIPHVRGRTDADAVFGMVYAQAEDDFHRIEWNYLDAMGRRAEAEGEREIWRDLRMKLFIDPDELQVQYAASPAWLQALMKAWADGLNYYLATHPETKPAVLRHFEPWMALSFSEGSIGGDIEDVSLRDLEAFYSGKRVAVAAADQFEPAAEPGGSNGIAIAPSNTKGGHALLLINPHTSFFFREELQVTSDEGLDAYGAVTWGQFFVYQGFNSRAGWMHTSSGADVVDEYAETIVERDGRRFYEYGNEERPVASRVVAVPYRTAAGPAVREFTVYRTHHGPVVREASGKWITVKLMNSPVAALTQSYLRTKAKDYAAFRATMELHTNSSNNTIFADADGDIVYFHANHVAKRDPAYDWRQPVDGSTPATEWGPLHGVEQSPFVRNPASGWLYNSNNWPYSAAGPDSPRPQDQPAYMDNAPENERGLHAIALLANKKDFTLASLRDAAFDSWLPPFFKLVPGLVAAWDDLPADDARKQQLADQVKTLREWDHRWSAESVATSLAVFWGERLWQRVRADPGAEQLLIHEAIARGTTPAQQLDALAKASDKLTADFGTWRTPWGEINRFQRLTDDLVHPSTDAGPSIPVPFTSAVWGSLASFGAHTHRGSKRIYGTSGNSFVAVVEFGDPVRALAVTAGGVSGEPGSKHFNDQAERYAKGDLREVYFHPSQLVGHTERVYRPGEKP